MSIVTAQPVMHKLEYVGRGFPLLGDLDAIRNISIALLKPGRIARVDPEDPRFGRSLSGSVGILDGKLRLSAQESVAVIWSLVCNLPNTAEADECCPRPWNSTFLLYPI